MSTCYCRPQTLFEDLLPLCPSKGLQLVIVMAIEIGRETKVCRVCYGGEGGIIWYIGSIGLCY